MEAKELQISDLIQNTNGNKGKVIGFRYYPDLQSNDIVITYNGNDTTWSNPSVITPIPLTREILEKNGWDCKIASYCYYFLNEHTHLCFYMYEHRLTKVWIGIDEWQNHSHVQEETFHCESLNHVHEFQHALRLCGLAELSDNFKVMEE